MTHMRIHVMMTATNLLLATESSPHFPLVPSQGASMLVSSHLTFVVLIELTFFVTINTHFFFLCFFFSFTDDTWKFTQCWVLFIVSIALKLTLWQSSLPFCRSVTNTHWVAIHQAVFMQMMSLFLVLLLLFRQPTQAATQEAPPPN